MREIDPEVLAGFIDEAKSYLPPIDGGLARFAANPGEPALLEEAHRLVHSIKGAASMVGFGSLGHVAFLVEETIEELAAAPPETVGETVADLREAVAEIGRHLDGLLAGTTDDHGLVAAVVPRIRRLRGLPESGDAAEIARLLEAARPAPPAAAPPRIPARPAAGEPAWDAGPEASPELLEAFLDEAEAHLEAIGAGLAALRNDPAAGVPLAEIRRRAHTLKGAAAMIGLRPLASLTHRMEDLLDRQAAIGRPVTAEEIDLLFATADALAELLAGTAAGSAQGQMPGSLPGGPDLATLYGRYDAALGIEAPPMPDELARPELARDELTLPSPAARGLASRLGEEPSFTLGRASESPAAGPARATAPAAVTGPVVRVPLARLEELVRLVSELVVNRSTFEQYLGDLRREVGEVSLAVERLRRISGKLDSEYEVAALGGGSWGAGGLAASTGGGRGGFARPFVPGALGFDELELDRYTEFHLVTRELAETASDIGALGSELTSTIGDFEGYLLRLSRLTSEVQDRLLQIRMVPLANLATRLDRAVRLTAGEQGKAVDLRLTGAEVELDKTVLEGIADPLLHLMRNAVDHGIEPPELRRVLGKPERGQIHLEAVHEGTQVSLRVHDDGAGIDPETVRAAAVAGGFLSEAQAAELSRAELFSLLFLPGFSTAGEVSEISGRGVGLDVVHSTVQQLEGTVSLEAEPGVGTTLTIRLPVSLAILKVLLVSAGGQSFAVPLAVVHQILRIGPQEIERVGDEPVVRVWGEVFPFRRLGTALGLSEAPAEAARRLPVLILRLGDRRYALAVDQLLEAREVVVKSLGSHLGRVAGITGATLTGDGRVVLILNPAELVGPEAQAQRPAATAAFEIAALQARRSLTVMIVDDSLSVRRVLSNLVKSAGWTPVTARDGLEALEILERGPRRPDALLLDLEMPRMDGFELTAALRGHETLAALPIVILTSRAGEKHRRKAFEIGVTDYLVKPYQDEVLLDTLRRAVRARVAGAPTGALVGGADA